LPTIAAPLLAQQPAANAPNNEVFDVQQLFASTCGFCHAEAAAPPAGGRSSWIIVLQSHLNEAASTAGGNAFTFKPNFDDVQVWFR
jgi:cytochrome c5